MQIWTFSESGCELDGLDEIEHGEAVSELDVAMYR